MSARDDARERLLSELPVTERRLRLAGVSTAVLEGGDGPPVVLLHGPSGYAAHWMGVIPSLLRAIASLPPTCRATAPRRWRAARSMRSACWGGLAR